MTDTATQQLSLGSMVGITPMALAPLWRQTILLHGEPKIGKTTEAAKMKDAIFFDAEFGTMGIDVPTFENLLPGRDRINSPIGVWPDVKRATAQLALAKNKGIAGTVVIDTAQAAYDMCRTWVLQGLGISHETDLGYGKGWSAVKSEFKDWIAELKAIGFGIVFISHTKEIEIELPTSKYTKKVPKLDTGPNDIILPFVNLIMYAETQHIMGKDCRVMHTKGSNQVTAGERGKNPRLQALLPFDFDCLQANWDGQPIDLNSYFGFTGGAPAPPMVEAQPKAMDTAQVPVPNPVETMIVNTFDAKSV